MVLLCSCVSDVMARASECRLAIRDLAIAPAVPWKCSEGADDAIARMLRKHWVRVKFGRTGTLWLCKNCGHDFAGRQFA